MRIVPLIFAAAILTDAGELPTQNALFEASAAAIHEVVSGKTCVGDDLLIFGERDSNTSGKYERVGRSPGVYQVGYGTILILRGKELHSHVATVSTADHMLYMSTSKYRCERE